MFRLTQYMQQLLEPTPVRRRAAPGRVKPVVIWNLTRTCNLKCRHCYTTSADRPFPGELTHERGVVHAPGGTGGTAAALSHVPLPSSSVQCSRSRPAGRGAP